MQFSEGATVLTADGEKVGTVRRIVIDKPTREVTHLVVGEGFLLPRDTLVPIADVANSTDDVIELESGVDPAAFDEYVETRFVVDSTSLPAFGTPGFIVYPAAGVGMSAEVAIPGPPTTAGEPRSRLPETEAMVDEGTPVITVDGRRFGKVDEIVTLDDGRIDAIVVRRGWIFRRRRVIPVGWIREIGPHEIVLTVDFDRVKTEAGKPTMSIAQQAPGR
jgi:uncharacterized protein YrrD